MKKGNKIESQNIIKKYKLEIKGYRNKRKSDGEIMKG